MNPLTTINRYATTFAKNYTPFSEVPLRKYYDVIPDSTPLSFKPRSEGSGFEVQIANLAKTHASNPLTYATYPAAFLANAIAGDPVGGLVDAVTFGTTNLKADDLPSVQSLPQTTGLGGLDQALNMKAVDAAIPQMSADDLSRQVDYYRKRIRTDIETLKALEVQNYGNQTNTSSSRGAGR